MRKMTDYTPDNSVFALLLFFEYFGFWGERGTASRAQGLTPGGLRGLYRMQGKCPSLPGVPSFQPQCLLLEAQIWGQNSAVFLKAHFMWPNHGPAYVSANIPLEAGAGGIHLHCQWKESGMQNIKAPPAWAGEIAWR